MRWIVRHAWLISFLLGSLATAAFAAFDDGTFVQCAESCTVVQFTDMQRLQHALIVGCTVFVVLRMLLFLTKVLRAALDARQR